MKKTIMTAAAVLAAFMMISCQMPAGDSGDTYSDKTPAQGTTSDPIPGTPDDGPTGDPEETPPQGGEEPEPEEKILDFGTTRQYSMKVGETIKLPNYIGDYEVYYQVQSGTDVVSLSSTGLSADSVGGAVVKAIDWNDENRTWSCSISVTADGFNGTAVEYKLCGNWSRENGSSLVLNQNKTGRMQNYLNGELIQDWSFSWTGSEYSGNKYLNITACSDNRTNSTVGDKQFTVTNVSSTSLTIKGNLGFGMPSQTTWSKD